VDAAFTREGIDTRHAARHAENGVGRSSIIVSTREGTRNVFSQHTGKTGAEDNWPNAEVIRSARVLLIDHHGVDGSIRAARIAREAGRSVVADFEREDAPRLGELFPLVDHLVLPEDFACRITGVESAQAAVVRLQSSEAQTVIVTAGERGCWFVGAGIREPAHLPALRVEAVDTTGCGDVFHGAYAAALARGMELVERLRFASAAAAFKASAPVGEDGVPRRAEVEAMRKSYV
jgi:sugar/nucleoside kinase (ribokinase family)